MALGPGLPTRMVCPSPFWRTASAVPMVPPPPDRFSTIADWPHAVCRCAASNRAITSVVRPAAAGTMRRTFSVGRQSAAWPRRGKAVVADSAAAADSTRRRESSLVTFHSLPGFSFAGERRKCAGGRQADGLAQAPGLEHDPEKACPRATTRWVGTGFPRRVKMFSRDRSKHPCQRPPCYFAWGCFRYFSWKPEPRRPLRLFFPLMVAAWLAKPQLAGRAPATKLRVIGLISAADGSG